MLKCEIVRDLLPLYEDGICSEESKREIEEHLKKCEACREELKTYSQQIVEVTGVREKQALDQFQKKLKKNTKKKVVLAVLLTLLGAGVAGTVAAVEIPKAQMAHNRENISGTWKDDAGNVLVFGSYGTNSGKVEILQDLSTNTGEMDFTLKKGMAEYSIENVGSGIIGLMESAHTMRIETEDGESIEFQIDISEDIMEIKYMMQEWLTLHRA